MEEDKSSVAGCWISLIIRLSIFSLFTASVIGKYVRGVEGGVKFFHSVFAKSWAPQTFVTFYAYIVPFIETSLLIWLLVGVRLRLAWIVTGMYLITLSSGLVAAGRRLLLCLPRLCGNLL